jgi:hypothetical protein
MAAGPAEEITTLSSSKDRIGRLLSWSPLVLAAAYLVDLLVQFRQIVATTYLDADAASAPVIGQLYGGSPAHRDVVLGQMAWFSTLMFELATRWLPLHREIWEAAPYAMALVSAALIAWALWRIAGRWAAAIGGTLVVCAAPHTMHLLFSLNDHSPTWFSLVALACALALLEGRGGQLRLAFGIPLVVVVGVIVGVNMASDTLLVGAGLAPALIALAALRLLPGVRAELRALWWMLATLAVTALADVCTKLLMHHENVTVPSNVTHTGLATAEALTSNFRLWWQSIAVLGNGEFFGGLLGFTTALQLLCAALSIAAVVVLVPKIAWREVAQARATAAPRPTPEERRRAARLSWCVFWGSSAVLLSVGFIVSSTPVDIESDRYLVGLIYAAAALVPLLGARSARWHMTVLAGTLVFAFTGLLGLVQRVAVNELNGLPTSSLAGQVAQIAKREHLKIGYAGYWDAAPITWATHFAVDVYPVQVCAGNLCQFTIHYISTWYVPRPHTRTFLISDPTTSIPSPAVPSLGKPSAEYHLGLATMYVYPYDIASKFVPG